MDDLSRTAIETVEIALSDEPAAARRLAIGDRLMTFVGADMFVSYVCGDDGPFYDPVGVHLPDDLLDAYDDEYRRLDRLTPRLFAARRAVGVTADAADPFGAGFLRRRGMVHGINYFPNRPGPGSIDLRIWRDRRGGPFDEDAIRAVQAIGDLLDRTWYRPPPEAASLTPRERQIAALVAEGLADKEIASRLGIRVPTLRTHLAKAFAKTGAANRAALAVAVGTR